MHFFVSIRRDITKIGATDSLLSVQINNSVEIKYNKNCVSIVALLLEFVKAQTCRNSYATCRFCVTGLKLKCVEHIVTTAFTGIN
jgi:hypothetical protein